MRSPDVNLRRRGLHVAVLYFLPRHDKDLLLDLREFSGVDRVHQVVVPQLRQRQIHDQFHHIDFIMSSIQLSSITKKAFMSGYSKDREYKEAFNSNHDKKVLRNRLLYVKTNHTVKRLRVLADDRLTAAIIR